MKKPKGYRKIVVDGVVWFWKIGRVNFHARSEDGRNLVRSIEKMPHKARTLDEIMVGSDNFISKYLYELFASSFHKGDKVKLLNGIFDDFRHIETGMLGEVVKDQRSSNVLVQFETTPRACGLVMVPADDIAKAALVPAISPKSVAGVIRENKG